MISPGKRADLGPGVPFDGSMRFEAVPERLPWQVAAVVIIGLSALLWAGIGIAASHFLG